MKVKNSNIEIELKKYGKDHILNILSSNLVILLNDKEEFLQIHRQITLINYFYD